MALLGYSSDFNAHEVIWDWVHEEGTGVKVRQKVDAFLAGWADKTDEVKPRCRTIPQSRADELTAAA